ncbi:hypothetical protein RT944_001426 [Staphylococcus pseudintermedius]|nr:hypothetical protein [Staphylococcus pseudintermedius]
MQKIDAIDFLISSTCPQFPVFDIRLPIRLRLLRGGVHTASSHFFTLKVATV